MATAIFAVTILPALKKVYFECHEALALLSGIRARAAFVADAYAGLPAALR